MTTLLLAKPKRAPTVTILLSLLLSVGALFGQSRDTRSRVMAPQDCGSTFAGSWHRGQDTQTILKISVNGDSAQGDYQALGQGRRILRGTVTGYQFRGEWYEDLPEGARSGIFIANLIPGERRIDLTFNVKRDQIESGSWFCASQGSAGGTTVGPPEGRRGRSAGGTTVGPPGGTRVATPGGTTGGTTTPVSPQPVSPPPEPPLPKIVNSDQDLDEFQTFDSLTPAQQQAILVRRGPRRTLSYTANDLSMRVLGKSGWPIVLDYGLHSADYAMLSIEAEGMRPLEVRLAASRRHQIQMRFPRTRNRETLVAKVRIQTSTDDGDFRLYGFGVGEKGIQALKRNFSPVAPYSQLAMNYDISGISDFGRLTLLAPQVGASIQISVSLPSVLKVKQKPKNRIEFTYTSNSDFSDGRWEWWRVRGGDWEKVWQDGSDGISRNRPKSKDWDGIITTRKLVSPGYHALSLVVWQKAGEDHEWVVATTDPALQVVE